MNGGLKHYVAVNPQGAADDFVADGRGWKYLGVFDVSSNLAITTGSPGGGTIPIDAVRFERVDGFIIDDYDAAFGCSGPVTVATGSGYNNDYLKAAAGSRAHGRPR